MKIDKLNCVSCGAPIFVNDDQEVIVCPSCHSTLSIDRGEGSVTLKVMEKLAETIKENAYVTQVELRRMQINQLISMEEMKINTLQAEIRSIKRRLAPGMALNDELSELLLQVIDVRMHIRSLKLDNAHLDPGWEESLEVIRRDTALLDEAINFLLPYAQITSVQNRIVKLKSEKSKCEAQYNKLEAKLLRRELNSISYPPYEKLTLEEMEELREIIPSDLNILTSKEQTNVNREMQRELNSLLNKINEHYPRLKVESQAGVLSSLDLHGPYPEEPAEIKPLIDQIKADLEKLADILPCAEKNHFSKLLSEKLSFLTERARENIPEMKANKKKKKRLITIFSAVGLVSICIAGIVFLGISSLGKDALNKASEGALDQVESLAISGLGEKDISSTTSGQDREGQYEEYSNLFLEVTASVTYLREAPSINAESISKVSQGDILVNEYDESLSDQWYKVTTFDGSTTGYLAIDWVSPITINSIPGEQLTSAFSEVLTSYDFSTENSAWVADTYDDEFAKGNAEFISGVYELDITSNDDYIFSYTNQEVDGLSEEYLFSLTLEPVELSGSAYYGIQTNVVDDNNFDAVLINSEGTLYVLRVRNGYFNILYDTNSTVNGMINVNTNGENVLSMVRLTDPTANLEIYQYAVNGKVFAEVTIGGLSDPESTMGLLIYMDQIGDRAYIRVDDFIVNN